MMNKESICRNCFHSYVCEQFNENKDDNNTKCHFANDHYIPTADVVPRSVYDATQHILKGAFERVEQLDELCGELQKAKTEVAREIFAEIEKLTASVYNDFMFNREGVGMRAHYVVQFSDELDIAIANLKKKYTEER